MTTTLMVFGRFQLLSSISLLLIIVCASSQANARELSPAYLEAWHKLMVSLVEPEIERLEQRKNNYVQMIDESGNKISEYESSRKRTRYPRQAERVIEVASVELAGVEKELGKLIDYQKALDYIRSTVTTQDIRVVSRVEGVCSTSDGDNVTTIDVLQNIEQGSLINTDGEGFVEIVSSDGSVLHLGKDTSFQQKDTEKNVRHFSISKGKLHIDIRCVEIAEETCDTFRVSGVNYEFVTTDAELSLQLLPSGEERYYVHRGESQLFDNDGQSYEMIANDMITINVDGSLAGPLVLDLSWLPSWWK